MSDKMKNKKSNKKSQKETKSAQHMTVHFPGLVQELQ